MRETIFHFEDDGLISSILQISPIPCGDLELSDIFFYESMESHWCNWIQISGKIEQSFTHIKKSQNINRRDHTEQAKYRIVIWQ